ncbi:MAG: hypothetical protein QM621_08715 [Aeromicrobium sp.]|uniref:hypothetical protein n=1 Tax=Aeromicrobium sp. TaxID=1871063 RepID=UPI0039E35B63
MLVRLGYPPAIVFKDERTKYLKAMRKADHGGYGPLGELIARAVTNNLYRFVLPAAERGRLRAQKTDRGIWMSSKDWVDDYQRNEYKRATPST